MDIQIVLDLFGIITYVTDYWAKADEGLTPVLREAAKQLKSEPENKKRAQELANTFISNRQMGEAEAYYKILPNLTLKYSNIDTVFVPSSKKELRSKFLMKLDDTEQNILIGSKVSGGRDGIFLEKPDIIDKYTRRDIDRNENISELCLSQFAKMYEPINSKRNDEYDDQYAKFASDDTSQDCSSRLEDYGYDMEYLVSNYIITANPHKQNLQLPEFIKIQNPIQGEVSIWKKRSFPKAMRIHKKKKDVNPNEYFLSELLLFTPYTDEDELGPNEEEKCRNLYQDRQESIQYVKSKLLPFAQGIEEARFYMEQTTNYDENSHQIGNILDGQNEQDNDICREEEEIPHPDFLHLDPDNIEIESNIQQIKRTLKKIDIKSVDELLVMARELDHYQKKVLNIAIECAHDLLICIKGKQLIPRAPLLMVHGGAGSGKSTVIKVLSQYIHHLLRKEGDDIDCPYVLLSAFTGGAASNIDGQTLHTLFSFNFGSGYQSLSDQNRDIKRALYKNLKFLIIDEISLVDADMLYKIDLRLREITQKNMPFGNVAIFAFGDMMQIKPVKGRYIMQCPSSKQFALAYETDSLWHKFDCIVLKENHRQGDDKLYADMLNRIRIGQETEEDIKLLQGRIRSKNHPDIKKAKDALFVFGTNKKVNEMNNKRLKCLKGSYVLIPAITFHKTIKNFKPSVDNAGNINNTPFQEMLKLKIRAKVMLTYNIDTSDGLTNGARGELIGTVEDSSNSITILIIKFDNGNNGKERQKKYPSLGKKYPQGTPIEKVNFPFSISSSKKSVIATANVIQFPLKLAFSCTAHKIQGATIKKPMRLVISVADIWAAAITYVMLIRICALWQLYILDDFDASKMYPSSIALTEMERLEAISKEKENPVSNNDQKKSLKICSLNCRSLKKHFDDILFDEDLSSSDIVCIQETWIEESDDLEQFQIKGFDKHFNSKGKGKGIAVYFRKSLLQHEFDLKEKYLQISKFKSKLIDIIILYRSKEGSLEQLDNCLENIIDKKRPTLITGDFNINFLAPTKISTKLFFERNSFYGLVKKPTHIDGNLLDQAMVKDQNKLNRYTLELRSKYYTDHKGLFILVDRYIK